MKIEISKEQKNNIAEKMTLCVDFLQNDVQPHLTSKDKVIVPVDNTLELHITHKTLFIKQYSVLRAGPLEVPCQHTYTLEKELNKAKQDKRYICEARPEAAIEFLKNWDSVKNTLMRDVAAKIKKVDEINSFIDNFHL